MYKIQLPVRGGFYTFAAKYKELLNREAVYKILFTDGCFYIGQSHNLVSRMYSHVTMGDMVSSKNLSTKHKRMKGAIENSEIVEFTIISDKMYDESKFIIESENDEKCLNMKR